LIITCMLEIISGIIPVTLHWAAALSVLVVCLALARRLILDGSGGRRSLAGSQASEFASAAEEFPELEIPSHRHVELALDPPQGLHRGNPRVVHEFENELCWGKYIMFHPPMCAESEGAGVLDFRRYFQGKKRLWELRLEFHFKVPPPTDSPIFFAIEMEKYVPLSGASKRVVSVMTAAMRKAAGGGLYQSPGDDPAVVQGELEKPLCALPLWAFDQFIETPEEQDPPSLLDLEFPNLGQKRYQRISEYCKALDDLKVNFRTGPTYQFAFWGISRFLDVLNWSLSGIPVFTPLDFDKLAGCPPVWAVVYTLQPNGDPKDPRHLSSLKRFYFKCAVWASHRRPSRARFESLTGASAFMRSDSDGAESPVAVQTLRQRVRHAMTVAAMGPMACCSGPRVRTAN